MKNVLLKEEISSIVKNKKILIPIIAVLFIPVLYAGMFLWAFWDPYAKLDKLPVAIVNNDRGASLDGKSLKLGNKLVKKLEKSKEFGFKQAAKKQGYEQLKNQKYYMLIEIPEDFSKNATTLLDKKPKKLKLIYVPNEGYNFLSAQIGGSAAYKIKTAVAEKVTETYAETMFNSITNLAEGVKKASDGAEELKDGSVDLKSGSIKLKDGLATLAQKSLEFNDGMNQTSTGSNDVASGTGKLEKGLNEADTKLPQLITGTNQAYLGAKQLKEQLPTGVAAQINEQLKGSVLQLNTGIDQFQSLLGSSIAQQFAEKTAYQTAEQIFQQMGTLNLLQQNLSTVMPPETVSQVMGPIVEQQKQALIANGIPEPVVMQIIQQQISKEQLQQLLQAPIQQQVSAELNPGLAKGFVDFKTQLNQQLLASINGLEGKIASSTNPAIDQLINGIGTINDNQKLLQQGIHELAQGSATLANGAGSLAQGMNQLTTGAGALTSGAVQLADGSNQLADGTLTLSDGAKVLADKLKDGAKEASKAHLNGKTKDMMAKPVKLDTKSLNRVPNYGTGFTPYFLSLGLFVGALILSIVFPFREPAVKPANGFNWFMTKFSILAFFGIIQALLADTIILAGLGLNVQSVPGFIFVSIITSLTFVTLIQVLVSVFADVGRFIAILILIFQLTTSAGTFPLELIPDFLQHFNAFLPMTYTVRGFKAVVSSGQFNVMWQTIEDLLIFMLFFISGSISYFIMKFKHDYSKGTVKSMEQQFTN